jgi:hypothetical protein
MEPIKHFPLEALYALLAVTGGVARYLNGFANGVPFKLSIFLASAFVAGFSGIMFAYMGISLSLPQAFIYMMAGTGGFFGEQTMKLVMEYVGKRSNTTTTTTSTAQASVETTTVTKK